MSDRDNLERKAKADESDKPSEQKKREREQRKHEQEILDEGIDESFPASDPPSISRRGTKP